MSTVNGIAVTNLRGLQYEIQANQPRIESDVDHEVWYRGPTSWSTLDENGDVLRLVPKHNLDASAAPLVTDDSGDGYDVGSLWIYSGAIYFCTDATVGAAVWENVTGFGTATANTVFAGPSTGGPATPGFRALVASDLASALAIPPAIGGTTPSTGKFTTIETTSNASFGAGAAPSARVHIIRTTEQLRVGYDGSNYLSVTIGATGNATMAPTGSTTVLTKQTTLRTTDAATNTIVYPLAINHDSSDTPTVGFGTGVSITGKSSTTSTQSMFLQNVYWTEATHATRKARVDFRVFDTASRLAFSIAADGSVANVGFYGTAPAVKQEVTGSRGGNVALASLLTGLATIGLITDSSSA